MKSIYDMTDAELRAELLQHRQYTGASTPEQHLQRVERCRHISQELEVRSGARLARMKEEIARAYTHAQRVTNTVLIEGENYAVEVGDNCPHIPLDALRARDVWCRVATMQNGPDPFPVCEEV